MCGAAIALSRVVFSSQPCASSPENPEIEALKMYIHSLEIRLVKLEQTVKLGGLLLGIVPTALQLYQIFHR